MTEIKTRRMIDLWAPVFVWAFFIFSFSSLPTNPVSEIRWKDFIVKKSAHVVLYAILTITTFRALKESGVNRRKSAFFAAAFAIVYGVSDEFHQSFTPGRDPKIRDVIFDTIGSVLAIYFLWNLLPKAPQKLKNLARNLQLL